MEHPGSDIPILDISAAISDMSMPRGLRRDQPPMVGAGAPHRQGDSYENLLTNLLDAFPICLGKTFVHRSKCSWQAPTIGNWPVDK